MIVLIGAGNVGRELLAKLSRHIDITCIDAGSGAQEVIDAIRGKDRARVISIGITEKGTKELEGLGVAVKNILTASANDIRNLIEHQAKTAHGIGIIYRDGNIIMPKRDTVLKEKDRVIIPGDPDVLRTVAEMLTADFQKFPLEYGTSLLVYVGGSEDERFFEEVHYVYNLLGLNTLCVVYAAFAERMASGHDSLAGRYGWKSAEEVMSALPFREAIRSAIAQRAVAPGLVRRRC